MDGSILIVDADADVAVVTEGLTRRIAPGRAVQIAPTPMAAAKLIDTAAIVLLIIEPQPDTDASIALIAHLKAQQPQARVLVVTSQLTPELKSRLTHLGVSQITEKPALLGERLRVVLTNVVAA